MMERTHHALDRALRELGRRLRAEREAAGMTQEEVADEAGCHRVYISMIEKGTRNVTVGRLLAVSDVIGVDLAVLVTGLHVIEAG